MNAQHSFLKTEHIHTKGSGLRRSTQDIWGQELQTLGCEIPVALGSQSGMAQFEEKRKICRDMMQHIPPFEIAIFPRRTDLYSKRSSGPI